MNNMNTQALRRTTFLLAGLALASLTACTSIGYRCPLDPSEKPESETACLNMQEAMEGAKNRTGGRTSVFLDDQGRIIPRELVEQRIAQPIVGVSPGGAGYYESSGQPAFIQPKVFQVWSGAYQDAEGNLHDGHHSWFSTPGRWSRGSVSSPGVVGKNLLQPATPNEKPAGRIVTLDQRTGQPVAQKAAAATSAQPSAQAAGKDADAAALKALSQAANSSAATASASKPQPAPAQPTAAPGITAPSVQLRD